MAKVEGKICSEQRKNREFYVHCDCYKINTCSHINTNWKRIYNNENNVSEELANGFFLLKLCQMVHIIRMKVGTDERDGDIF